MSWAARREAIRRADALRAARAAKRKFMATKEQLREVKSRRSRAAAGMPWLSPAERVLASLPCEDPRVCAHRRAVLVGAA